MKTIKTPQRRRALAMARCMRQLRKTWKDYVATRQAYCDGRATIYELAHALALHGAVTARRIER